MPKVELQPQSEEPPLLASVRDYWTRKRGDRALPRRRDIVPSEIRTWLPQVLLAEVIDGGADFRYRLVGSKLRRYFPSEPTGKLMSEVLAPFGAETINKTLEIYAAAVTLGEPLRIKGDGAWFGQEPKYFEAILAPLSDDGGDVNMIFGAFDFLWDHTYALAHYKAVDDQAWDIALEVLR